MSKGEFQSEQQAGGRISEVSLFTNTKDPKPAENKEFEDVLRLIKEGKFSEEIEQARSNNAEIEDFEFMYTGYAKTKDPEYKRLKATKKEHKESLMAATFSGTFSPRKKEYLITASGIAVIDLDKVKNPGGERDRIFNDFPFVIAAFISPSGNGVKVLCRIPIVTNDIEYKSYYLPLMEEFTEAKPDKATTDISRLCFLSHDPDLKQRPFEETTVFVQTIEAVSEESIQSVGPLQLVTQTEFDENCKTAEQMISDAKDGEKHHVLLRASHLLGGYLHGSTEYYNQAIEVLEAAIDKRGALDDGAKKTIRDGLKKGMTKPLSSGLSVMHKADIIEGYLVPKVTRNRVTGKLEINGKELTDIDANSMYLEISKPNKGIGRPLFDTVLNSHVIESYDPFKAFIDQNKHRTTKGHIHALLESIDTNMTAEYLDLFLVKWLTSIIASAHGTYSLMILVLTGDQMTGKTKFFRGLLPPQLRGYYAESKLDDGKDSEILMTQKLIIVDDEYSGKNKTEAKKLKDISSKQCFDVRRPYGKISETLLRIAVLGGTSNEDAIINDPTGNRRIIPLKVNNIDFAKYDKVDKNDLFMELFYSWEEKGNEWWMLTKEEVKILSKSTEGFEQEIMEDQLVQTELVIDEEWTERNTTTRIIEKLIQKGASPKINPHKMGSYLTKRGYLKKSCRMDTGRSVKCWNAKVKAFQEA